MMLKCHHILYMKTLFSGTVQLCIGSGRYGEKYSTGDTPAMETGVQETSKQLSFE